MMKERGSRMMKERGSRMTKDRESINNDTEMMTERGIKNDEREKN